MEQKFRSRREVCEGDLHERLPAAAPRRGEALAIEGSSGNTAYDSQRAWAGRAASSARQPVSRPTSSGRPRKGLTGVALEGKALVTIVTKFPGGSMKTLPLAQ